MAMLYIFILFFSFPCTIHSAPLQKLPLPSPGPESFAFDLLGGGPYTTVADGRILKYKGPNIGFIDYGFTSPNRYVIQLQITQFIKNFIWRIFSFKMNQYF